MRFVASLLLALCSGGLSAAELAGWYPFQADGSVVEGSVISLHDWLPPIDDSRRVTLQGDKLLVAGAEAKFWGINNNFGDNAPPKEEAAAIAAFYAKYGINLVRLHKATKPLLGDSLTTFDADGLDRFHNYLAELGAHGVYYAFSLTFKIQVGPKDKDRIPAFDQIYTIEEKRGQTVVDGDAYGLAYVAPEIQDLIIEQMVKLLQQRNAYNDRVIGTDPALAYVEIINEDNMYFFHALGRIHKTPFYKQRAERMFSEWLGKRYGDQAALAAAWGDALGGRESIAGGNIAVNVWPQALEPAAVTAKGPGQARRWLDTARFFYDLQNAFYDKASAAIREAGFAGPLIGSNWISRSTIGGFWDLMSNAKVGIVDRHNYHAGQQHKHWGPMKGPFNSSSMLPVPGSSLLSSGLEQVLDRPFMLSEWIHVFPNEWVVEGPAVIAAYGMGLQGWDLSTIFSQSGGARITDMAAAKWDAQKPNVIGAFPAIARQVLRQDVQEAAVLATMRVSEADLEAGTPDVVFDITSDHDIKSYDTDRVPRQALAIGRVGTVFGEHAAASDRVDPAAYLQDGAYVSTTGELRWWPGETAQSGYFTIASGGTKAAVGFLGDRALDCDGVTIHPERGFAAIYVTARDRDGDLATDDEILITAIARARNQGAKLNPAEDELLDMGDRKRPVLMEPVVAEIAFSRPGIREVVLLDDEGVPTGRTLPVANGVVRIDTARDRTPYYLVRY